MSAVTLRCCERAADIRVNRNHISLYCAVGAEPPRIVPESPFGDGGEIKESS